MEMHNGNEMKLNQNCGWVQDENEIETENEYTMEMNSRLKLNFEDTDKIKWIQDWNEFQIEIQFLRIKWIQDGNEFNSWE